tara:strand:- start:353 stop:814 length:462 start_codon:yes stop_codon:yes gene_type:complete
MAKNSDAKTGQPIYGFSEPGFNHVGSYQVSCRPFATASVVSAASSSTMGAGTKIEFPGVTKFVIVRNEEHDDIADSKIRLAFASGGLHQPNYNYILINPSSSFSADYRVSQLYIMSDSSTQPKVSVIAGITTIKSARTPSGSWENTVGVDKTS